MQQTANYGFLKPEDNEAFDEQAHANANMDAIDVQIKARADDHAAHLADNVKHTTQAEKDTWNAKETPVGAQAKVDALGTLINNQLTELQMMFSMGGML